MNAASDIKREYEVRKYVKSYTAQTWQKNNSVDTWTEKLL